jgi:hypothetical protein
MPYLPLSVPQPGSPPQPFPSPAGIKELLDEHGSTLRDSGKVDLQTMPGMLNVKLTSAQLKTNPRSFLDYDAYVVVELATPKQVNAPMGQGFWADEHFEETRGKTQGGNKTSVCKDTDNPTWDECLIVPCAPVKDTVVVVKVPRLGPLYLALQLPGLGLTLRLSPGV